MQLPLKIEHYLAAERSRFRFRYRGEIKVWLTCIITNVVALPENPGTPGMSVETSAMDVLTGLQVILDQMEDFAEPILSRLQIWLAATLPCFPWTSPFSCGRFSPVIFDLDFPENVLNFYPLL